MSHFKATSIKIKSNGEISCIGDDNNVFPKHNRECEFNGGLKELFEDLVNGNIQPIDSANGYKWAYAMLVAKGETFEERFEIFKKAISHKNHKKYVLKSYVGFVKQRGHTFHLSPVKHEATVFNFFKAIFLQKRYKDYLFELEEI